jgi:coenzyme F420-reducing hydrogenase alpha subunit
MAVEAVTWSNSLAYPELEIDYEYVALHDEAEYGLMGGEVRSSSGKQISVADFESAYLEKHVRHSNALHGHTVAGGAYLVGPLARLNLNHDQLGTIAKKAIKDARIKLPLLNPYKAFIARAVELVQYLDEAIQLIENYSPAGAPHIDLTLKPGEGCGATEAPRGLLFHKYRVNDRGLIETALIVPPTAQNLPRIEADLLSLAPTLLRMELPAATRRAEDLVRAYDPCISCATHFLKLRVAERASP